MVKKSALNTQELLRLNAVTIIHSEIGKTQNDHTQHNSIV